MLGPKKNFAQKILWVHKFEVKKTNLRKTYGRKKIKAPTYSKTNKIIGEQKNFSPQIFGPKSFSPKEFGPKN